MTQVMEGAAAVSDVGVVIVTHDNPGSALLCAEAVAGEVEPSQVVIVVNDPESADPETLAELRRRLPYVVLNERSAGYGANLNVGVTRLVVEPRYYLLLNDDAYVARGTIEKLRSVLESDSGVGLVGPQLVSSDGEMQPSWHGFPTLASELVGMVLAPASILRFLGRWEAGPGRAPSRIDELWPVGAALLVRAEAFRAVGGFDEGYFLYSEETDLARRLRDAGWEIRVRDDAIVRHVGHQSTNCLHERLVGTSRWRYARKHWRPHDQLLLVILLPLVFLWNLLYVAARVLLDPGSAREKAAWLRSRWVKRPLPDVALSRRQTRHAWQ